MAKNQPVRKEENQPVNIGDRAIDNLRFIRETMEGARHFTAVPGYGGIFMGLTAVAAALIANNQTGAGDWLLVWVAEAALAFLIGLFAMWQKAKIAGTTLTSAPARKFALGFLPPLICGTILTFGLWRHGAFAVMIPSWLLLYGAAVVTGGAFSVKAVPAMGWCFIALGSLGFLLPTGYENWLMLSGFGLLHTVFGIIIARKHGG